MTNTIVLTIPQPPQAQGRPRFSVRGSHAFAWDPHKDKKNWARLQMSQQFKEILPHPIDCSLDVSITYHMPIPKSTSKKKRLEMIHNRTPHIKKPDIDNLIKFTLDAMNDIIFHDDSQIWYLEAKKIYSEFPRTEVVLTWNPKT